MKTFFAFITLIVFGIVANILAVWILNIAGIPGALLAMDYKKASNVRKTLAVIVVVLCQSYVYLSYVAFIVNWTMKAASRDDVPLGFVLWLPAFVSVFFPVWLCMVRGRTEAREDKVINAQIEALPLTWLLSVIGFLIFALFPSSMEYGWSWVPYMGHK